MKAVLPLAVLIAVANAAPAPQVVTVWQVATQVVNNDGSVYTYIPPVPTAAVAVSASADVAAAAPIASASAQAGVSAGASAGASTGASAGASTGASAGASTGASADSSGVSSALSWLKSLWSDYSSSKSGSSQAAAGSAVASSTVAASAFVPIPSTAPAPYYSSPAADPYAAAETTTSSSSSVPQSTSTSTSGSSGSSSGIYADIGLSSGIDSTFSKNILDAHNQKRALHDAPELSWDKDAYDYAQKYADNYDCSGVLTHSHGPFGENLAAGYHTGVDALDAWYDEGQSYNYAASNSYDHFTQVVWKSTTKLGCAYKDCSSTGWGRYIICSYDPAGNVVGQSKLNVLAT
ncbi:secreted protein Pry1p [[Candida] anglica]|uniref:Secreted protein Pry1p n=1 Tax=[Candida] anglica TaxID=148631 RepID=A0ABP0EBT2_9ASCO